LQFKNLGDFTPEGIAHQVPELQKLLELRDALSALKSPLGNRPEFRKRIQAILADAGARERMSAELKLDGATARRGEED
jgi:type VI secretion system protein ImpB